MITCMERRIFFVRAMLKVQPTMKEFKAMDCALSYQVWLLAFIFLEHELKKDTKMFLDIPLSPKNMTFN